jgi:ribonuclease P protein component
VLPAAARLTSSEGFRRCVRSGRRAGSRTLVVHLSESGTRGTQPQVGPQVGFVVSRAVGSAVVRNRVRRRLRHLVRDRLGELPAASVVVVRALPAAAGSSYDELRDDLARCLERVLGHGLGRGVRSRTGHRDAPVMSP